MNKIIYKGLLIYSITFLVYSATCADIPQLIKSVVIEKNRITVAVSKEFADPYIRHDFFAEYDPSIDLEKLDPTIAMIPFLTNVIPIVWISNKTFSIDAMDEDLYHAFNDLQKIFQVFYPQASWSGSLVPRKLVKNRISKPQDQVVTLFSHGLDAVYTALHNHTSKQVLTTVCGSDIDINRTHLWESVQAKCKKFAQTYGHTNAFVRSNFRTFRNYKLLRSLIKNSSWFGHTSQSLGYVGLAAPIAYAKGSSKVLIASTRTSDNPVPYGTHPVIDNRLAFAGITVEHDGPEVDRLDKIREIVQITKQHNLPKPMLRVCWGKDPNGGNCTKCEKCFRTIVELLVEGQLPSDYGFPITLDQAIKNARAHAPGKQLGTGLLWHWNCIKKAAGRRQQDATPSFNHPGYKPFVEWLASVDMVKFARSNIKIVPEQQRKAFAQLWHKAAQHTFTIKDLELVAPFDTKTAKSNSVTKLPTSK